MKPSHEAFSDNVLNPRGGTRELPFALRPGLRAPRSRDDPRPPGRPGPQRRRSRLHRPRGLRQGRGRPPPARTVPVGLRDRRPPPPRRPPRRGRSRDPLGRAGLSRPPPDPHRRSPRAGPGLALQLRDRDPPGAHPRRRPQAPPAELPGVLREAPLRHPGRLDADPHRRLEVERRREPLREVLPRVRPLLLRGHRGRGRPGPQDRRRGLRGHVGSGHPRLLRRPRGRDRHLQPLGLPHHRRPRRRPPPPRPLRLRAPQRRLPLLRSGRGRVHDRPGLGRPDDDLRVRRSARRGRALHRRGPRPHDRRRRSRPPRHRAHPPELLRGQRRLRERRAGGRALRPPVQGGGGRDPAGSPAHRPRPRAPGRPLPLRPRRPGAPGPGLLRGLQHPGLGPRSAPARDREPEGRHRGVRRSRFDACAHRRRARDGPPRAPARGHPRLHDAGIRDFGGHEVERPRTVRIARRPLRDDRHHTRRPPAPRRPQAPLLRGRRRLRRDLRERPGGPADRLPLPDREPSRRHRPGHRRPVGAGAGLVHLRRRRPDEPLRGEHRRAEDDDPAPHPLGRRLRPVLGAHRRGPHPHPGSGDLPRARPGQAG